MADAIITRLHPATWHDRDTDFARWLHPAMWHVALELWQWIHQVAAPCNVTRSSGIMTLNSPGGSILQCGRWLYMGWHAMEFAQTSAILEFYTWFRVWPYHHNWHIVILLLVSISTHHRSQHVIMHQSAKFYPNRTTLSRKNWRHVDFQDGGPQPSWILGVP